MFTNPGNDPTAAIRAGGPGGIAGQVAPSAPMPAGDPSILNGTVHELDDGGAEIEPAEPEADEMLKSVPHSGNLAEALPESVLNTIAIDLEEGVNADVGSNDEWYECVTDGLKLLGLKPGERLDKPFKGSPAAYHPMLKEAVLRFTASATGELLPADGPARCKVFGDDDSNAQVVAMRKQEYMNFFLTEEDQEYYDDFDQMTMLLGLYGSMFRRLWRDPTRGGIPTSRFLTPFDLVVSDHATTLNGPYRVTHIETVANTEIKRLQRQAWYVEEDLMQPTDDTTKAREVRQNGDWRRPTDRPEDSDHILHHVYCMLDIEGLEHTGEDDEPTGLALPYVVTIHVESQKVLRIQRNWKEDDTSFKPLEHFVHYKYMPGLGFMGWGFIHLIGSDTDVMTTLRRQALTSFSLASFPGGLKSRTTGGENTDIRMGPGEFADIETGGLPIQQAVMPLPYRDIPGSFEGISNGVLTAAQRVASTGDMAVGDAREDALPGTVIALIKRSAVLESSVIKRMHRAQRRELRMLADLIGQDGREVYPYSLNGKVGQAVAADFADNANITPVSDPNVPTQTERLSLAQATMTIAQQSGGMVDMRQATEQMFRVMGKTDAEIAQLMPPPPQGPQGQPADPVTEFGMAMHGAPLMAAPQQDHAAHIQCHVGQMAVPGVKGTPAFGALQAHIGDHTAKFYAAQVQAMTGVPVGGPPNPQTDAQIAAAVAASSNQLHGIMQQLAPEPASAVDPAAAQKVAVDAAEVQAGEADSQRKAVAQARQDAGEITKMHATMQDAREQRAFDLQREHIELERSRIEAGADMHVASSNLQKQALMEQGRV